MMLHEVRTAQDGWNYLIEQYGSYEISLIFSYSTYLKQVNTWGVYDIISEVNRLFRE